MNTDLRIKVAELCGYTRELGGWWVTPDGRHVRGDHLPAYDTDPAAAHGLLAELVGEGHSIQVEHWRASSGRHCTEIETHGDGGRYFSGDAEADTHDHAFCLAACEVYVKAMGGGK